MQHVQLLTPGEVADRLRVSAARVRQLDAELAPYRTSSGRRVYRAESIERLAARRDAKERAR